MPDLSGAFTNLQICIYKFKVIPENLDVLEAAVKHLSSFLSGIAGKKYASSSLSSGLSVYFETVVASLL